MYEEIFCYSNSINNYHLGSNKQLEYEVTGGLR